MQNKKVVKIIIGVVLDIILFFLILLSGLLLYYKINYTESYVKGASMYPTLNANNVDEDIVGIDKSASYTYGDIVTAKIEKNNGEIISIIKRVIGLEGDYINIVYNEDDELVVLRNGNVIDEPYIKDRAKKINSPIVYINWQEYIQLVGDKYVEGEGLKIGKNEVFILGDNRQVSGDSSKFGPVNKKNIEGKVKFVYKKNQNNFLVFLSKVVFKF